MELRERLQKAPEVVARNKGKIGAGVAIAALFASAGYVLRRVDSEPEPDPSHIGESIAVDPDSLEGKTLRIVLPASGHTGFPDGDSEDAYMEYLAGLVSHEPRPNGEMDPDWEAIRTERGFDYRDGDRFDYSGRRPQL